MTTNTLPALPTFDPQAVLNAYDAFGAEAAEFSGYEGFDYEYDLTSVVAAMRDENLFGEYVVDAVLDRTPGEPIDGIHYSLIVPSPGGGSLTLTSRWVDLRSTTTDRSAKGADGIVAIARAAHEEVAATIGAARNWIAAASLEG